jgi:phosphoribosylglycinamide formyltransferase 1
MIRIAVFASGAGTNALQLLATAQTLSRVQIKLVLVDRKDAPLLAQLKSDAFTPVKTCVVVPDDSLRGLERRAEHERQILAILAEHEIDFIFLAGYMRILSPHFVSKFKARIVNIHPSLLPKFPGLNAYENAFASEEGTSGITVHLVDDGVDTGPVLAQESFERQPTDTLADFIARGKSIEWILYPQILRNLDLNGTL